MKIDIISKNRTWLLGIATIWVALFHTYYLTFANSSLLTTLKIADYLNFLKRIGNSGVDIFLCLSGYGLYYSFYKDNRILKFYKKRLLRVFPALLLVSFIYYGFFGTKEFSEWLQQVFLYGFWIPGMKCGIYWYFSLLILLYIAFPLFFYIIKKYSGLGTAILVFVIIVGTLLLRKYDIDYCDQIEIGLTRMPVFIFGIYIGKKATDKTTIPIWLFQSVTTSLVFYIILLYHITIPYDYSFVWRYLYCPLAIMTVIGLPYIHEYNNKKTWSRLIPIIGEGKMMNLIGIYSMEIYLIYERIYLNLKGIYKSSDKIGITYAIACFSTALLLSIGLHNACETIKRTLINKDDGCRNT